VHTLGNYLRQTGAEVTTVRAGPSAKRMFEDMRSGKRSKPDLAVLSPGPGNPGDFDLTGTLSALESLQVPGFGVCLGLQGALAFTVLSSF
jgi:anthranilate synthase